MLHKAGLLGIVLVAALIVACQPGAAVESTQEVLTQEPTAVVVDQPTAQPVVTDQPTAQPATAEPSDPGRVTGFEFEGIFFSPDNSMTDVVGEYVEGQPVDPEGPWWVMPAHYRFDFLNYPLSGTFHAAQLYVIPVANFEGYPEAGPQTVQALSDILANRPDLSAMGGMQNPLPQLPLFNAAQVIVAQPQYLDFQNGSGIRYLTQYDQGLMPINNNELIYTYQGLTSDGLYYVAGIFPINHPDLPGGELTQEQYDAFGANVEQALADATALLYAADPASFTPDLSRLDAMMQTISVAPTR